MGPLLLVVFFLTLFVVVPLKAAALFSGALLLATLVVQATATTISRVNVSLTDSFKAIVYSVFFTALAIAGMFSFMAGVPREVFMNPASFLAASVPLLLLQYGAYVLGFKVTLGLTLMHSIVVAALSTLITSGAIWFIARMASQGV